MTILIVDDERDILESILAGIDFAALGITGVLTATSASMARAILQTQEIDILLTDIEMPGESGLDLLDWLRNENSQIITIFCTSYANFDYAKKAVEMHCFNYYLKPISYADLQVHLSSAVEQVYKNRSDSAYQKMGRYWETGQKKAKSSFWSNLLFSVTPPAEILHEGAAGGLAYSAEEHFAMVYLFVMDKQPDILPEWKIYGFQNIAGELFGEEPQALEAAIPITGGNWVLVLRGMPKKTGSPAPWDEIITLIRQTQNILGITVNGYYLDAHPILELRAVYTTLNRVSQLDILRREELVNAADAVFPQASYDSSITASWADLFTAEKIDALLVTVKQELATRAQNGLISVSFLKALRNDLLQMVSAELNRCGIYAHVLFQEPQYELLLSLSLDSLARYEAYLAYLFQRIGELLRFTVESRSVVEEVKAYIQNHLGEEINRDVVGQKVFLNPDYLARLFKKETGQTLSAYLLAARIEEAKKLLRRTQLPVNEIAQRVGYGNYSYFSHMFRKATNVSPRQYRKQKD